MKGADDEQALYRVLQDGAIVGAAIDVFEAEPLAQESPLRTLSTAYGRPFTGADGSHPARGGRERATGAAGRAAVVGEKSGGAPSLAPASGGPGISPELRLRQKRFRLAQLGAFTFCATLAMIG